MSNIKFMTIPFLALLILIAGCGKKQEQTQNSGLPDTTIVSQNVPSQDRPGQLSEPAVTKPVQRQVRTEVNYTIPNSTQLSVALSDSIQTNINHTGDYISGTLASPLEVGGATVIPAGAKVDMVLTKIVKGGRLKTPPEIALTIRNINAGGTAYSVSSDTYYQKGRSHTKREVGMIGGGAAAGGIIGGVLGKGKGAAIGAAAGAAAGTGVAAATGQQNLVVAAGQTVTFTLQQSLRVRAH